MTGPFVKHRRDAPPGFLEVEAAGLRWLALAEGGVPVAAVLAVEPGRLVLERVPAGRATAAAARAFGARLAATHSCGADWFGQGPPGWAGDGFVGNAPLSLPTRPPASWGSFFARERVAPYLHAARDGGALDAAGGRVVERVCESLDRGDPRLTGAPEPVARLHGDLWSGNVLWSPAGAVLVDCAAHGGHRETDLAMLALFGLPHLAEALAAYDDAWPLAEGWRERVGLHQLFPLLVHAVLFGPGYGAQAASVAARYA